MSDDGKPVSRTLFCGCVVTTYPALPDWPAGSVRRPCAACKRDRTGGVDRTPDHDARAVKLGNL